MGYFYKIKRFSKKCALINYLKLYDNLLFYLILESGIYFANFSNLKPKEISIMKKILLLMLLFLLIFSSNIFANNFQHISTFGINYWNLTNDTAQAKWLAQKHDWSIGGTINETVYDAMKSANPNIKFMPYIAYNTYELSIQNWIKNWCERNGYNFEDTFYHYFYDTEVKLRGSSPSTILIKGYVGGTAKTLQEARVPSTWASYSFGISQITGEVTRFNINPTSRVWRLGYQAYILENRIKINASKGKYADGIFLDSFDGTVYETFSLQLERTIEMRNLGKYTRAVANAQVSNDLIAAMKDLKTYLSDQAGRTILTVPNTGDVDGFYQWRKFIYEDRLSDYSHVMVEYMVRAGSSNYRIKRLQQVYDTMVNKGLVFFARNETSILDISEKVNQFLIASHYLINHPNYNLTYHRGSASFYGGSPAGQLYTTHWHKNLEYDIGTPIQRSGQDYWGASNTDRFFIFASGIDYTIVGREYANALVLAKFGNMGGVANAGTNPTTHPLNGTFRLLQPDNSLGSPITEITLGASEGAILIKEQQAALPAPPPTIVPSPLPEPSPEPAPTPTPEPAPSPTGHQSKGKKVGSDKKSTTTQVYMVVSAMNTAGPPSGNIKKYEISTGEVQTTPTNPTTTITSTAQVETILDATKTPALDSNNQIKDSSKSFWSSGADGKKANEGGVGEVLLKRLNPRNIFTYLGDSNVKADSNTFGPSNEKITPELLGFSKGSVLEREKLIQYVHGYDAYSREPRTTSLRKKKWLLGAIVNSRPLVISYGNSKKVIYVGANDGMLHAFDDATGEELWGFIPNELLPRLKDLSSSNSLKYYVDGSPKAYITNSQKIIVFGLRRGGNNYYALDVTEPDNPRFLWKIGPETPGYSEMGQSWSTPHFGRIRYESGSKIACFVGGGYDENQDKKNPSADKKGRAVYVVDLLTGEQIWRWDFPKDPKMNYSIPSDIARVDINGDGYIDRLYVGDTGGRLWRFNLQDPDPNSWSGKIIFNSNTAGANAIRKIFLQPDVTLERDYEMIFFGTGDREHPDTLNLGNGIYAIKDKNLASSLSENNLEDVTNGCFNLRGLDEKQGWFIRLDTNKGESVSGSPIVLFGVAYFSTFTPSQDGQDGFARVYALNYNNGNPILNLNSGSGTEKVNLDLSDRSKVIGTGSPSGTIFTAINGKALAYTGIKGGICHTPLRRNSLLIPIWWREVTK